jgi:formylglycine-generating enzyme required for sulfatase activity
LRLGSRCSAIFQERSLNDACIDFPIAVGKLCLHFSGNMKLLLCSTAVVFSAIPFASAAVDFEKDVKPILEQNCVRCHNPKGTDFEKGDTDLDLTTFETATESKSTIVAGNGAKSKLYTSTVLPDDAKKLMPPRNKATNALERITKQESETIKQWIDEGAKWPKGLALKAVKKSAEAVASSGEAATVAAIYKHIMETPAPAKMEPYSVTIPGTDVKYDMVPIPAGEFVMGSPASEKGHKDDEAPQHKVKIEAFWMEKCEVTWNEFELFMYPDEEKKSRATKGGSNPETDKVSDAVAHPTQPYVEMSFGMGKDGFPAISMTQHAAIKYCEWLSAKTGQFYRLPTEAEWEYACRAGTTTAYSFGDDASKLGDYAWYAKNSSGKYQKIGLKKPNPWGLFDMYGNVCEWCLDQYDPAFYKASPAASPWNKATTPYPHVARRGAHPIRAGNSRTRSFRKASGT